MGRVARRRAGRGLLVADRRDRGRAVLLRARPPLRLRLPRRHAEGLGGRHLAARRHRRRRDRERAPRAPAGLPVLPGHRSSGARTRAGHRGRTDRGPDHRRSPGEAHELVLAWTYEGGTIAPPFVESAPGDFVADLLQGAHPDDLESWRRAARREPGAGHGRRRPSDGPLRRAERGAPLRGVVLRDDAPAQAGGHPDPHVRSVVRRRSDRRGLAAHRQAVLRPHRQPVDRGGRRRDLRGDPDPLRRAARPRRPQRRRAGVTRRRGARRRGRAGAGPVA